MCLVVGIIGAVGGLGLGAAKAVQSGKTAATARGIAQNTAGGQAYYAKQLHDLIANPDSISSSPGYKFQFDQGTQAVARQMAGQGFLGSTNEADALDQFGQGLASSFYGQQVDLLSRLSGLTAASSPAQDIGAATAAQGESDSTTSGLMNSLMFLAMGGKGLFGGSGAGAGAGFSTQGTEDFFQGWNASQPAPQLS